MLCQMMTCKSLRSRPRSIRSANRAEATRSTKSCCRRLSDGVSRRMTAKTVVTSWMATQFAMKRLTKSSSFQDKARSPRRKKSLLKARTQMLSQHRLSQKRS